MGAFLEFCAKCAAATFIIVVVFVATCGGIGSLFTISDGHSKTKMTIKQETTDPHGTVTVVTEKSTGEQ